MTLARRSLRHFRGISILDGISLLVLLAIAVPLKHIYDMPTAVRVIGPIHGALWLWYLAALAVVAKANQWSSNRVIGAAIISVVPIAPFVFERTLAKEQDALEAQAGDAAAEL